MFRCGRPSVLNSVLSLSPPTKAGFGLGALNEAEDDDIDVYDSTTHADRTYMPYDAIRDADDGSNVKRGKLVQKVVQSFPLPTS
jgi:G patch domain-containing protein 1